jgi:hypothetical protein
MKVGADVAVAAAKGKAQKIRDRARSAAEFSKHLERLMANRLALYRPGNGF